MVKKMTFITAMVCFLLFFSLEAFAEEIGVVSINKIVSGYSKAQEVINDLKTKEAEVQKLIAAAKKNIQSAKTFTQRKSLEEKYNRELQQKSKLYAENNTKQWDIVQKNILDAVQIAADNKKITIVLKKDIVICGGTDLTGDVLAILNTPVNNNP